MKFYVATSLSRAKMHNQVRDALISKGHELTYDWTLHGSVKMVSLDRLAEVGEREVKGIAQADVVVLLLPGGKGTHVELGLAAALKKPIILHSETKTPFKLGEEICAFYCLKGVKQIHCSMESLCQELPKVVETMVHYV
ncbi:MAG: hypothetical protein S4CHLAM45_04080 [Chlamydiales bacterium]|nr:hypothetical protein [Chlamydiales bacterium]MCH9619262.1 hypothetical protein [Chlamydiales bacterium]MCH9622524.1 hypothetical protein [Chlamydiales bacterium]